MSKSLFPSEGRWFRGNLHLHSTESDGGWSPAMAVDYYKLRGYDFVALTDHFKCTDTAKFASETFLTIPSEELARPDVVGIGLKNGSIACPLALQDQINAVNDAGGLAIIAHPSWTGFQTEELLAVEGYIGIEVYNHICEELNGKGFADQYWDQLLTKGRRVWGFANDDAHFTARHPNGGRAWNMVRAAKLDRDSIIAALRAGHFYATQGPRIESLVREDRLVTITTSPAQVIRFKAAAGHGRVFTAAPGESLNAASFQVAASQRFVRVEVLDALCRMAWSQPIFFEPAAG